MRLLDAASNDAFAGDPAGPYEDGLPDEIRLKMKRIPIVVGILRQIDRVSYLLSVNAEAASSVQTLYALTSPYLKRLEGWAARWGARPCAGVRVGDRWVPTPQPSDYGAWLELIMDGLADAGVVFEATRLSYVGPDRRVGPREPPRPESSSPASGAGSELSVGTLGLGGDPGRGAGPVGSGGAAGFDGLGVGLGVRDGVRTLGVRVQPGRRAKRRVPMVVGAPGVPIKPSLDVPDASGATEGGERPPSSS